MNTRRPFWVSWYAHAVPFEWNGPWWISGCRGDGVDTICAAVMATSEEDARQKIVKAHDKPVELEWRFSNEQAADWMPFCERFPGADWMRWPWPTESAT